MMRSIFYGVLVLGLCFGCDDEETRGAPDAAAASTPFGCYDLTVHRCDCDTSMTDCEAAGLIWAESCYCDGSMTPGRPAADGGQSMSDAGAPSTDASMPDEEDFGCYDPAGHTCDCDTDAMGCGMSGGIWTETCMCAGSSSMSDASMGSGGPEGCYDHGTHRCDCDTTEADCASAGGIWTEMCMCG